MTQPTPSYNDDHLTEEQKRILDENGTEAPFTGKYYDHHEEGVYHCARCGASIFSSDEKYDSGSGWPSFTSAQEGSAETQEDTSHFMRRTEVHCRTCKGHLGHVFDDGPAEKGGKRFCVNSAALSFEPTSDENEAA